METKIIVIIKDYSFNPANIEECIKRFFSNVEIKYFTCIDCALEYFKENTPDLIILSSWLNPCQIHPKMGGPEYGVNYYKEIIKTDPWYEKIPVVIESACLSIVTEKSVLEQSDLRPIDYFYSFNTANGMLKDLVFFFQENFSR